MFKILKGGTVYNPEFIGEKDVLVSGNIIANIADNISPSKSYGEVEVIDIRGKYIVPGFIDQHVHIIGGGGEGGFQSRTPEILLSHITRAGVTTVVGCLGTDGTTRSMKSLIAKARGLETEGISTYIYTGSYEVPTQIITDNVRNDIILIDKIIGCGEIAISDHRSAQPSKEDIKKLAAEARVGGMLSGKAGVLHLHVGNGHSMLKMLFEILEESEIPITQFTPTHLNRNKDLLEESITFAKMGGMIDFTSSTRPESPSSKTIKASRAVMYCLEKGVSISNISMSSDGNGSLPKFDERGQFQRLDVAAVDSLYQEFKDLVKAEGLEISEALKIITVNIAKSLKLYPKKGALLAGSDADIVILNQDLEIEHVLAKGKFMVRGRENIVKGTFE